MAYVGDKDRRHSTISSKKEVMGNFITSLDIAFHIR